MALHLTPRDSGAITVVDASGRITLGDGSANLRKTIRQLVEEAHCKIVLNLADVDYIDSSGIGELVSAYTAVRSKGGELKLCISQKSSRPFANHKTLHRLRGLFRRRLGRPEFPLMSPSSSFWTPGAICASIRPRW